MKKLKEQKRLETPPRPRPQELLMKQTAALQARVVALFAPLAVWKVVAQLPSQPSWGRHPDRMDVLLALTAIRLECVRVEDCLRENGPQKWPALKKVPVPNQLERAGLMGDEPTHRKLEVICAEMDRVLAALEPLVIEITGKPAGRVDGDRFAPKDFLRDLLRRNA